MKHSDKLMAIDLDGTLLRGNTLRIYMRCGLGQMWRRHHYGRMLRALWLIALRRLRLIHHTTMKFGVIHMIDPDDPVLRRQFVQRVDRLRNPQVRTVMSEWCQAGGVVVLATAAADVYVPWIWSGPFLATKTYDNPRHIEMRGPNKAHAVSCFARDHGLQLWIVVTDHIDDLPLMEQAADGVILVNADRKTIGIVKRLALNVVGTFTFKH